VQVSLSCGIADLLTLPEGLDRSVAAAEIARKSAKSHGRDRVARYRADDNSMIRRRQDAVAVGRLRAVGRVCSQEPPLAAALRYQLTPSVDRRLLQLLLETLTPYRGRAVALASRASDLRPMPWKRSRCLASRASASTRRSRRNRAAKNSRRVYLES
jgi:hypothetical protein